MKRIITILAAGLALLLTGCAADMTKYYEVQGKALEADNNAVMALAAAAANGNQGAIVALAMRQGASGKIAPPQDKAMQWASILVPTFTQLYGISKNTTVQLANIEAESTKYGATLDAITGISSQGIEAASKPPVVIGTTPMGASVLLPRE